MDSKDSIPTKRFEASVWGRSVAVTSGWRCSVAVTALALVAWGCSFPNYEFVPDGGGVAENCTNSVDDDGDGTTDCEDTDCASAGYDCVPEVPAGWTGPVAFWTGKSGDTAPTCSSLSGYETVEFDELFSGISSKDPTCPTCTCEGAPVGETRTTKVWWESSSYYSGLCAFETDELCAMSFSASDRCRSVTFNRADLRAEVINGAGSSATAYWLFVNNLESNITGGSCQPKEMGAIEKDAHYSGIGRLCMARGSTGSCDTNRLVCTKKPSDAFSSEVCVYQEGDDLDCPLGYSSKKPPQYRSVIDNRSCTECSCPANWGKSPNADGRVTDYGSNSLCTGTYVYRSANPGDDLGTVVYLKDVESETRYFTTEVTAKNTPTCSRVDPEPTGLVDKSGPITVCCTGN